MKMALQTATTSLVSRIGLVCTTFLLALGLSAQSQVFNSNGNFTVPAGVTSITVEAWGGGGGGANGSGERGGGGGGAYARSTIAVSPGQMYSVVIGLGGSTGSNGGNSTFGTNLVVAEGGRSGAGPNGGDGGDDGNSTGDVTFSGGDGGDGRNNGGGGGGGGSAFTNANGQNGEDGGGSSGGDGGNGTGNGGDGGDEDGTPNAETGNAPGGGGGGRGDDAGSSQAGANGRVTVSWCLSGPVTLPFNEGFESAGPTLTFTSDEASINGICNWAYDEASSDGRVRFGVVSRTGSRAALLDNDDNDGDRTNYLILTLDMTNYTCATDLALSFYHAQYGDEDDGNDRVWIRGSNTDSWIELHDLTASQDDDDGDWALVSNLDIDQALANNGQSLTSTFQIRFGQEDNASYDNDGRAFDDISIAGTECIGNGCTDPVITNVEATENPICVGEETTLSVTGTLGDATEWHWYTGSCGGTPAGTGSSINVSPTTTTTYYVRGEGGCVAPGECETIEVTVHPVPQAFTVGGGGAYCDGGQGVEVTLSDSQGSVGYQLKRDGNNVGPAVLGLGLALNFGYQTVPGTYTVEATNSYSCSSTMDGSAVVSVTPNPVCSISNGMADVCPNSTGNQYGAPAGMDSYSWSIDGDGSIPGATNGQSVSVTAGASGTYTLTVTISKDGCTASCEKTVNIAMQPFQIVYTPNYCEGETGPMIGMNGSENGAMYQLQTGGGTNIGAPVAGTGAPINFGVYPNGMYKVVVTGGLCDAMLPVNVNASPITCSVVSPEYCTCNSPGGYSAAPIKINAPAGQTWTVVQVIGLYGPNPHPQIAPNVALTYVGNDMYMLNAFRDNNKGYFIQVTNGMTTKDIQVGNPSW